MLSRLSRMSGTRAASLAARPLMQQGVRMMATGPAASAKTIPDDLLKKLGTISTQGLIDGLWVMGWPTSFIEGARPLGAGMKACGRAVTLRMVPQRPDIAADKPGGMDSPEYEAFEECKDGGVLVISSVGPWESVGGDIKFLRLKQLGCGGIVTDGSVRDTNTMLEYGFPVYSYSTTAKQGPAAMQPWEANGVIECGGVVVRPGDAIVADQDGAVVVPASHAEEVYKIAHGREEIEEIILEELRTNPGPPGKYYPFKPPIKPESPLGKLLTSKGHKFYSTSARRPARFGQGRRHMSTVPKTMKARRRPAARRPAAAAAPPPPRPHIRSQPSPAARVRCDLPSLMLPLRHHPPIQVFGMFCAYMFPRMASLLEAMEAMPGPRRLATKVPRAALPPLPLATPRSVHDRTPRRLTRPAPPLLSPLSRSSSARRSRSAAGGTSPTSRCRSASTTRRTRSPRSSRCSATWCCATCRRCCGGGTCTCSRGRGRSRSRPTSSSSTSG